MELLKFILYALIGGWLASGLLILPAVIRAIRSIRREEQESYRDFIVRIVTRPLPVER